MEILFNKGFGSVGAVTASDKVGAAGTAGAVGSTDAAGSADAADVANMAGTAGAAADTAGAAADTAGATGAAGLASVVDVPDATDVAGAAVRASVSKGAVSAVGSGSDGEDFSQIDIKMDVIAQIAGRAALEVGGVHAVDGGIQGGIAAVLGRDNSGSGIKVQLEDNALIINANIITRYGERIPEVAWNLQEHIKKSVEDKVGITVQKVNVLITGVKLPKENYE